MENFESYVESHSTLISGSDIQIALENLIEDLLTTSKNTRVVFTAGNGGSASTSEHLSADLNLNLHRKAISGTKSISLSSQIATNSALANDFSFESSLAMQLRNFASDSDLLILFSASGESQNIVTVAQEGKRIGMKIHAITGFQGGKLLEMKGVNQIHFRTPIGMYGEVENLHLMVCHYVVSEILKRY